jgi:hypothetical protein
MRRLIAALLIGSVLAGCGDESAPSAPPSHDPDLGSSTAEDARACLEAAGFDVRGGRSDPGDRDAPDVELTFAVGGDQVFVGVYANSRVAADAEAKIRRDARPDWLVERRESTTIVWAGSADPESRATVERCVFA